MRNPTGIKMHRCCPSDWRHTPDMTGSYELDSVIQRNSNKDMIDRLSIHLQGNDSYVRTNAYNATTKHTD